jgi:FtsH-binding integral membrane protein
MSFNSPIDRRSLPGAGNGAATTAVDLGLRQDMLTVYHFMGAGLGLTGLVAYVAVATGFYQQIAQTPLIWIVMLTPLVVVLLLSFRIERAELREVAPSAVAVEAGRGERRSADQENAGYADIGIEQEDGRERQAHQCGIAPKRYLGSADAHPFLVMGLIGMVLASFANIFIDSTALQFAISVIGVLVFTGLTAWDTQRIKEAYLASDPGEALAKKALIGALSLYLDFTNLFVLLLQLTGQRRE